MRTFSFVPAPFIAFRSISASNFGSHGYSKMSKKPFSKVTKKTISTCISSRYIFNYISLEHPTDRIRKLLRCWHADPRRQVRGRCSWRRSKTNLSCNSWTDICSGIAARTCWWWSFLIGIGAGGWLGRPEIGWRVLLHDIIREVINGRTVIIGTPLCRNGALFSDTKLPISSTQSSIT